MPVPFFQQRALPAAGPREELCCFEGAVEEPRRRRPLAGELDYLLLEALELDPE